MIFFMSAYGFEDNYSKAWPSGEIPLKEMRRVIDCGQLSVVGVGKEAEQFDIEVPIHDGRLLSESEVWLSLSMRIKADAEALNSGGTGAGSGGNRRGRWFRAAVFMWRFRIIIFTRTKRRRGRFFMLILRCQFFDRVTQLA